MMPTLHGTRFGMNPRLMDRAYTLDWEEAGIVTGALATAVDEATRGVVNNKMSHHGLGHAVRCFKYVELLERLRQAFDPNREPPAAVTTEAREAHGVLTECLEAIFADLVAELDNWREVHGRAPGADGLPPDTWTRQVVNEHVRNWLEEHGG